MCRVVGSEGHRVKLSSSIPLESFVPADDGGNDG